MFDPKENFCPLRASAGLGGESPPQQMNGQHPPPHAEKGTDLAEGPPQIPPPSPTDHFRFRFSFRTNVCGAAAVLAASSSGSSVCRGNGVRGEQKRRTSPKKLSPDFWKNPNRPARNRVHAREREIFLCLEFLQFTQFSFIKIGIFSTIFVHCEKPAFGPTSWTLPQEGFF